MAQAGKARGQARGRRLRTEYAENPLGIDARKPRLSWQLQVRRARRRPVRLPGPRGARASAACARRQRPGVGLGPGGFGRIHPAHLRRTAAAVRASGTTGRSASGTAAGRASAWSAPAFVGDGPARRRATGRRAGSSPTCRKTSRSRDPRRCCAASSSSSGPVERARAYVTSHGLYELQLNGQRVGDELFTPGLDQLQQAPAVPDLRRDAPPQERAPTRWGRCSATAGTAGDLGLAGPPQHLRRPPGACSARSRSPTRTAAREVVGTDQELEGVDRRRS